MTTLKLMPCALVDERDRDFYFVLLWDLDFLESKIFAGQVEILASVRCAKCGFVCLGFTKVAAENIEERQKKSA